jgi:hypothetical protein
VSILQLVGFVARAWIFALDRLRYGRVREPFFVLGGVQLIVLILLGFFHHQWLAKALTPLVAFLGGEEATHYPEHFWRLPELYRHADALLMVVLGAFAYAAAALGFTAHASRWPTAFRSAGTLIPIALLGAGSAWAITSAFNLVPMEIVFLSSVVRLGLQMIELALIVTILSVLAVAPLAVVLDGASLTQALAISWQTFRSYPFHILLMIAVPWGLLFPVRFFLHEMNMEEAGLAPQAVGLILTGLLVVRILFDALTIGALTFLFVGTGGGKR